MVEGEGNAWSGDVEERMNTRQQQVVLSKEENNICPVFEWLRMTT